MACSVALSFNRTEILSRMRMSSGEESVTIIFKSGNVIPKCNLRMNFDLDFPKHW
jgi:hypothetical protein